MNQKKLVYNTEYMDKTSATYKECAEYTNSVIVELAIVKTVLLDNYQGQATDMVFDLYDKIKEHLDLLKECFAQMERYITYSKETMLELDYSLALKMKGEK